VADAVRERGYEVHTLWSVYGDNIEDWVPDPVWIEDGAKNGWIMLTKDDIRYAPGGVEAMERGKARVFYLSRQDLPGPVQVQWFMRHLNRIIQRSRKPGPFACAVYEYDVVKRYP
jgi:PIN like domain